MTAFRPLSDKHTVVADIPDDLPAASGVRRLAQAQHGEVAAGSRPSGGTAMCLRLPLA